MFQSLRSRGEAAEGERDVISMTPRCEIDRCDRGLDRCEPIRLFVEDRVHASSGVVVEGMHGMAEVVDGQSDFLGDLFDGLAGSDDLPAEHIGLLPIFLADHQIYAFADLLLDMGGDARVIDVFVDESLTLGIHQDPIGQGGGRVVGNREETLIHV